MNTIIETADANNLAIDPEAVLEAIFENGPVNGWLQSSVMYGRERGLANIQHPKILPLRGLETWIQVTNTLVENAESLSIEVEGTWQQPHFVLPTEVCGHLIQIVYRSGERLNEDTIEVHPCGRVTKAFLSSQGHATQLKLISVPPDAIDNMVMLIADYRHGCDNPDNDDVVLLHLAFPTAIPKSVVKNTNTKPRTIHCEHIISFSPITLGTTAPGELPPAIDVSPEINVQ